MKGLPTFYHLGDVSIRDVFGLQDLSEQFTTDRPGLVFIEQTVQQKDFRRELRDQNRPEGGQEGVVPRLLPPLERHLLPGRVPVELGKVVHHDGDWQRDDQHTRHSSTGTCKLTLNT